jgi:large subunit ribosomal protein LP0
MVARSKKVAYFAHLEQCLSKYQRACIVDADFVGSKQLCDIRVAMRGSAEVVFGKNTMIRKCLRDLCADGEHPEYESIIEVMRGNLGFIFTNGPLQDIIELIQKFVKPAAAKAGVIAPCSCTIPKGPTGLDPAQTSFFQALNIATKINKGSIEIINDCQVVTEGNKVGTSEAALLAKLGVKPFMYGLNLKYIYEGGVFSPDVLNIKDADLMSRFNTAVGQMAALSLGLGITNEASLPHHVANGFKNVVACALELDFMHFEEVRKIKDFLDNPDAFVTTAVASTGDSAAPTKAAAAPEPEPEPEEEEEDMGFDLFD